MKVIIANYRYFVAGGPEQYMFRVTEALRERGVEVIPFSVAHPQNEPTPYADYFARPRSDALMFADTRLTPKNLAGLYRATVWNKDAAGRLKRLIRDTGADVVYILHEINHLSPSIIRAAHEEGVRVVHRISDFFMFCPRSDFLCGEEVCETCMHGDYTKALEERCVKGSRAGTLLRVHAMRRYTKEKIFDEVDRFVCTCEFTAGKLIEGGIPKEKITCIPTFFPADDVVPASGHSRTFLFLGRLAAQKGARYAVEAMRYLKDTDYRLVITGTPDDSKESREILRLIDTYGLKDAIVFAGFVRGEALRTLIDESVCVLCPSIWYENLPNTVIEAYAHGKSVIASDLGSLREMVVDGETGFLFAPKDAADLAAKMRRYIDDETLSGRLGQNARALCLARYHETGHMDRLMDVLTSSR